MSLPTILVADDDVDTRHILRALLERDGFAVLEAASGTQACGLAGQLSLSLIILNHPIDVDEHVTLAGWLRAHPATRAVPIINLTSRAIPSFIEEARALGVTATIAKPLDVTSLLQMVRELTAPVLAR